MSTDLPAEFWDDRTKAEIERDWRTMNEQERRELFEQTFDVDIDAIMDEEGDEE